MEKYILKLNLLYNFYARAVRHSVG